VRVEPPKAPIKKKSLATITTTTLPDVADIAEKKRRDDIMAERKLAMKDEKKIVIAERPKLVEPSKTIEQIAEEEGLKIARVKKKPWKEMTDEEKKVVYKERAVTAKATRARKRRKEN